jgi:signal transduction histidine kinase
MRLAAIVAATSFPARPIAASHDPTATASCHTVAVTAVAFAARRAGLGRYVLPTVALAYGLATVSVATRPQSELAPTIYAVTSDGALVADLAAGLGLLAAGAVAAVGRPSGSVGPLTTLLGVAWLAPDWIGWEGGSALARSVAMVAVFGLLPVVVHLALAFPAGVVIGRRARLGVAVTYGMAAVIAVGRAAVRDPFLDLYCWSNCTDNVLLVDADLGAAKFLDGLWLRFAVVAGVGLAAACGWRLARASPAARSAMWYGLGPAALVGLTQAAHAGVLVWEPAEDPRRAVFAALFVARAAALALLAAGVTWSVVRARRICSAVARLADELGAAPAPGMLRAALARSLGDDSLDVLYWLRGSRHYVDASGHAAEPCTQDGQAATQIVRQGEPVALVLHDRSVHAEHDLEHEIGPAARLAVDNERLRAEVLSQLEHLRASRVRIVETADATRRRLERDLHDGAQQRLLAVSYQLRLARAAAEADGERVAATALSAAEQEARCALSDLRDLAHGIFPAVLTEAGLGPALWTLADQSAVPVDIEHAPEGRYPSTAETAAYLVVREAVEDGARRSASHVTVRLSQDRDHLVVEVRDDGNARRTGGPVHLGDRVGAVGGRLDVRGAQLRAEIPCA